MGKAKNATKPPTDAEIWDDSALVRTWDEAVEEYKVSKRPSSTMHVTSTCISDMKMAAVS